LHNPCGGAPQQRGPLTPQTQTRPNRLHTPNPPPTQAPCTPALAHTSSLDTSRATHAHPTSPRSTGFCAIWDCISSSSSSEITSWHRNYGRNCSTAIHTGRNCRNYGRNSLRPPVNHSQGCRQAPPRPRRPAAPAASHGRRWRRRGEPGSLTRDIPRRRPAVSMNAGLQAAAGGRQGRGVRRVHGRPGGLIWNLAKLAPVQDKRHPRAKHRTPQAATGGTSLAAAHRSNPLAPLIASN